jgi:hypothetical protein
MKSESLLVKVSKEEKDAIHKRFMKEGAPKGLTFSGWIRMTLLPEEKDMFSEAVKWLESAGFGFLLDKDHAKVKEALHSW